MSQASSPTLHGLRPWNTGEVRPVPVQEGDVYRIGRLDRRWLQRSGLATTHLALAPVTRLTVPVVAVTLAVGRNTVDVHPGQRYSAVEIDGRLLAGGAVRLAGPRHEVVVDPLGLPQSFQIRFDGEVLPSRPVAPSGSTVVPVLTLTGPRLLELAIPLSWPLVSGVPAPFAMGWSTGAVVERHVELYGREPRPTPRRTLFDLRLKLREASGPDGRPLATRPEIQPWPWPEDWRQAGFLTEDAFFGYANMVMAGYFSATPWLRPLVEEALDRPRDAR